MLNIKTFCGFILVVLILLCSCTANPPDLITPLKQSPSRPLQNVRVALVLGGGGARGVAHAGVLEVLAQNHIPVDLIVGVSSGALIGALYADEPNTAILKRKIISMKKGDLIDLSMVSSFKMLWQLNGFAAGHNLRKFLHKNLNGSDFDSLKIPLIAVTTDANTGETYPIQSGPLIPALEASSALPMIFRPIKIYGRTLIDGGVSSPLPVGVAKAYHPQVIIAVDIGTTPNYGPVKSNYQLGNRALHISYYHLTQWQAKQADVLIHPAIDQYSMFEDKHNLKMYEAGKIAAQNALPIIRDKLRKASQ